MDMDGLEVVSVMEGNLGSHSEANKEEHKCDPKFM